MGKIAFLFAGQGAQFPGMGKDLYEKSPLAKAIMEEAEAVRPGTINQLCDESFAELNQTKNTQACVFLMDYIAAKLLEEAGIAPEAVAGFSLGEIAALTFAGSFSFEEAFDLVVKRGEYMQACGDAHPGKMAAVLRPDFEQLAKLTEEYGVYQANINSPAQISVSGSVEKMDVFMEALNKEGVRYKEIAVSGPFHTPYMEEAGKKLVDVLAKMDVKAPKIPVYANMTGLPYSQDPEEIRKMVSLQVSNSVLFKDTLENLEKEGFDTYLECGPGKTLTGFVKKTVQGQAATVGNYDALTQAVEQFGGK